MSNSTTAAPVLSPETVAFFAEGLKVSQVYCASVYAVLVWEFIVTFKDEYKYIWPSAWTPIKVLFLLNRYCSIWFMALVVWQFNVHLDNCDFWFRFQPISLEIIVVTCACIFAVRIYALYGKPFWMIPFFGSLVAGEAIVMAVSMSGGTPAPFNSFLTSCVWSNVNGKSYMWLFFAYPLTYDTLVFGLTAYRCYSQWRMHGGSTLQTLIIRDGLLFYAVVFIVNLLNTVSFVLSTPAYNPALHSPFAECITSMMCSRIVLNLRSRDASNHGIKAGTGSNSWPNNKRSHNNYANTALNNQQQQQQTGQNHTSMIPVHLEQMGIGMGLGSGSGSSRQVDLEGSGSTFTHDGILVETEKVIGIDTRDE